jgi:NACHT domain
VDESAACVGSSRWTVWHRVGGLALLLALGGVVMFLWSGPDEVLDRGDKLFSVISGLVAVISLVASAVTFRAASRAARWSEADPTVLQSQAAKDLASWVQQQWRREATARLLDRPEPLRMRWSSTSRPVAPTPGEVLGAAGPQGRVLRLRLGGDVNEVVNKFLQLPHRQLVVLGQPGAGKSVLMLLLTLGLLRRWRSDQPVPALLNLSSWNPNCEDLDAWLARRLAEEYPALGNRDRYGSAVAVRLVKSDAVLPVLDGLDEMPQVRHAAAIAELNNALRGERAVVIACRAEEYQAAVAAIGETLGRAAVVELESVDAGAAALYLPTGQAEGQQRWAPVLAQLRTDPHGPLALALSTPLMVYLARTVYSAPDRNPAELCDPRRWATPKQIEDHLLDAYLPALYARGSAQPMVNGMTAPTLRAYPADRARHWLAYFAAQMTTLGTRDLAWWQLPRTIPRFELVFGLAVRFMAGIGFGLAFGLTYGFIFGLARGLTYGLVYGLAFGLGLTAGLRFSNRFTAGLAAGFTAGVTAALGIGLALGFDEGLAAGIEAGFVAGLGVGLITRRNSYLDSPPRQIELSALSLDPPSGL